MLEIDAASRTGVDDTRELLDSVQYTPSRGRYKVYIIDEVHMLSKSSFNALLKTLEEPPPHVKFILATTDPEKIPVTILSRCLQFNLRRLVPSQIKDYLESVVAAENIQADTDALVTLSRAADGSMRDGLSLLDQAIAFGGGSLSGEQVKLMLGNVDHEHVAAMISALASGEATKLLDIVRDLLAQSRDPDRILTDLAESLHRICLVQCVQGYTDAERSDWDSIARLAAALSPEDAQLYYQIAIKGREELGIAPDPRTGLEMTLLRMLAFRPLSAKAATSAGSGPGGGIERNVTMGAGRKAGAAMAMATTALPKERSTRGEGRELAEPSALPELCGPKDAAPPRSPGSDPVTTSDWIALTQALKLNGPVRELARNIHLRSAKGDHWEFVIPGTLVHLGTQSCISRLNLAVREHLGRPVMVKLVVSDEANLPTEAEEQAQQALSQKSDAERAIHEDPVTLALRDQLGARIIEESIQPLQ
jgi:DNA polymerase-3 subunit gamma/tau